MVSKTKHYCSMIQALIFRILLQNIKMLCMKVLGYEREVGSMVPIFFFSFNDNYFEITSSTFHGYRD